MRDVEKGHWKLILIYGGVLCVSLLVFLARPDWRAGGVAWNSLFQVFGPTVGTVVLCGITVARMVTTKISPATGIASMGLLAVISGACLAVTLPMMMHV